MVSECIRFLYIDAQQGHYKNRTNVPTMQEFVYAIRVEIILTLESCQRRTISKLNIKASKQIHTVYFFVIWLK